MLELSRLDEKYSPELSRLDEKCSPELSRLDEMAANFHIHL